MSATSTWNQFSDEVAKERELCRSMRPNALSRPTSLRMQALRELALRLNLEDEVSDLRRRLDRLTSDYEAQGERLHDAEKRVSDMDSDLEELKARRAGGNPWKELGPSPEEMAEMERRSTAFQKLQYPKA